MMYKVKILNFLKEQQEEEKPKGLDNIIASDISIFEMPVKVQVFKSAEILVTEIRDKIRGILSVTTVGSIDLPDKSQKFDLHLFNIKFELERGEVLDRYVQQTLIPRLREIKGMQVLHYGEIKRIR